MNKKLSIIQNLQKMCDATKENSFSTVLTAINKCFRRIVYIKLSGEDAASHVKTNISPSNLHQFHLLLQFSTSLFKGFNLIHIPHQIILNSKQNNA